jgi:hypothetical protein
LGAAISLPSPACAARYVAENRAEWVGSSAIRFHAQHHRHQAAVRRKTLLEAQTERGYDGIPRINLDQIAGVPVLFPWKLIRGPSPKVNLCP